MIWDEVVADQSFIGGNLLINDGLLLRRGPIKSMVLNGRGDTFTFELDWCAFKESKAGPEVIWKLNKDDNCSHVSFNTSQSGPIRQIGSGCLKTSLPIGNANVEVWIIPKGYAGGALGCNLLPEHVIGLGHKEVAANH